MTETVLKSSMTHRLIIGHVMDVLKSLPDESVDLCVTSPPYWGLRDYGANCSAKWPDGWEGQLGLEPDFHLYLDHLVSIFGEVKRVLKKNGSFYLNIGDTYSSHRSGKADFTASDYGESQEREAVSDLPAKCLIGIPERLMLRLVDEQGWIRRNTLIWYKRNHMPSSVKDRLANSYEPVYFMVKSQRYHYDLDAIRVPHEVCGVTDKRPMGVLRQKLYKGSRYNQSDDPHLAQYQGKFEGASESAESYGSPRARTQRASMIDRNIERGYLLAERSGITGSMYPRDQPGHPLGKNPGDVLDISPDTSPKARMIGRHQNVNELRRDGRSFSWEVHPSKDPSWFNEKGKNPGDFMDVTTQPFKESHFATYPEALVEPFIKSSCPKDGIVLDPFGGSGTTAKVARDLGRNSICVEINPDYEQLWHHRLDTANTLDIEYLVQHFKPGEVV